MSTERQVRPRKTNEQICDDVEEVKELVQELQRTIRGFNGVAGLATKFETLEARLLVEIRSINDKLSDLSNKADEREKVAAASDTAKLADATNVKWPLLFDKIFAPVIVAIIVVVLSRIWK